MKTGTPLYAPQGTTPASLSGAGFSAAASTPSKSPAKPAQLMDVQTEYIRSDIVRIILLLVVVAVILGIISLVNAKTSYLRQGGEKLGTFLRL